MLHLCYSLIETVFARFCKVALTILMTGLLFSGQAFAVSDDGGLLDFSINSGNATITGFTAGTSNTTPISNSNFSIY